MMTRDKSAMDVCDSPLERGGGVCPSSVQVKRAKHTPAHAQPYAPPLKRGIGSLIAFLITLFFAPSLYAQKVDADLLRIKQRMDSVAKFTATVTLDLDVPFIQMPTKKAQVSYAKGKRMQFTSKDFVMLPKRGLDFSLSEIFKYPFITVDRGAEKRNGKMLKVLNVIPTDAKSDLVLVTLYMDAKAARIMESEINTRKDGSYSLLMQYDGAKEILPDYVEASFAIERLKIPFNFMGKDTKIDRKKMRGMDTKTGKIKMKMSDYKISLI
ncbi:hypothetical protein [Mucilaginibacter terrae]|uniref:Outer membrane lipoprotein carrier protein LolA n=1 Tax=Mucilaginibacter terrae TaxID=1955052 RepID=A0ABU3GUN5_9SPHI|nr:hypothetical protein [Mucilaginibacter terrae]MDT3403484.1 hypothetical protein [Mucilaginibacter terrae]